MCNGNSPRRARLRALSLMFFILYFLVDTDKAVEVRDAIAKCQFSRRTRIIYPK
jgi:hypothetical protein